MNLGEARDLVRGILNETTSTTLTNTILDAAINDGQIDVAVKGMCYNQYDTITVPAGERIFDLDTGTYSTGTYTPIKVLQVMRTDTDLGVPQILPHAMGFVPLTSDYAAGWFQWGRSLVIEPGPDTVDDDYTIYFTAYPTSVLSAAIAEMAIPDEFHDTVVWFALSCACITLKRWTEAAAFYNKYIVDVQEKRNIYMMNNPDVRALHDIPERVVIESA